MIALQQHSKHNEKNKQFKQHQLINCNKLHKKWSSKHTTTTCAQTSLGPMTIWMLSSHPKLVCLCNWLHSCCFCWSLLWLLKTFLREKRYFGLCIEFYYNCLPHRTLKHTILHITLCCFSNILSVNICSTWRGHILSPASFDSYAI